MPNILDTNQKKKYKIMFLLWLEKVQSGSEQGENGMMAPLSAGVGCIGPVSDMSKGYVCSIGQQPRKYGVDVQRVG